MMMMMMPLHCNTMTAKSIQIQSILCLFSTEEPCKDCLILTAIPCRVNPPSEQTQKILFNFFSKMAKRGMLHGTPKKFPKISKNFSRVNKIQLTRINWKIKYILSGLVTRRLYFLEKSATFWAKFPSWGTWPICTTVNVLVFGATFLLRWSLVFLQSPVLYQKNNLIFHLSGLEKKKMSIGDFHVTQGFTWFFSQPQVSEKYLEADYCIPAKINLWK